MAEPIVYQVRAVDRKTQRERIVHAYPTPGDAEEAIKTMGKTTGNRYKVLPVPNDPNQYWGIK